MGESALTVEKVIKALRDLPKDAVVKGVEGEMSGLVVELNGRKIAWLENSGIITYVMPIKEVE